jgi:hypothetical protein
MNRTAIICKLHEITDHYLLGAGTWPADRRFLPKNPKRRRFALVRLWKLNESSAGTYFEHILTFVIALIFQIEGMVACQYLVRKPNPWDFSMSAIATGRAVGDASGRRA